jgi:hypothetical protein
VPGFRTVGLLASADEAGADTFYTWRKSPSQASTAGLWFDLSMSPGNPVPQYYAAAPLVAVQMKQSVDGGIAHGAACSPAYKYLRRTMVMTTTVTALPMPMLLLDYLLYYPFIDEGTTDEQLLTNGVTLPRYTTGEGVQMMAVSVAGRTGGQTFSVRYTNSDGVADRISGTVLENTAAANGTIVTSATASNGAAGPFIPLQTGDKGVRSVEAVTMNGADVGLFALVLVKPLAQIQIHTIDAPVENDHFLDKSSIPRIVDDAYLNFICLPQGTLAATPIHGTLETCFN